MMRDSLLKTGVTELLRSSGWSSGFPGVAVEQRPESDGVLPIRLPDPGEHIRASTVLKLHPLVVQAPQELRTPGLRNDTAQKPSVVLAVLDKQTQRLPQEPESPAQGQPRRRSVPVDGIDISDPHGDLGRQSHRVFFHTNREGQLYFFAGRLVLSGQPSIYGSIRGKIEHGVGLNQVPALETEAYGAQELRSGRRGKDRIFQDYDQGAACSRRAVMICLARSVSSEKTSGGHAP